MKPRNRVMGRTSVDLQTGANLNGTENLLEIDESTRETGFERPDGRVPHATMTLIKGESRSPTRRGAE